ncbi:hypothetical protein ABMA27_010570 [Loxostege sticticalis]|uniref:Regulatory protein zeste n=1 Tax=Loxostege sticticalis TaxID=481309 RepID=A0ABR3H3W4_LOXSC
MDPVKKKRGENWSTEEKEILRQLIAQSAKILEDKSTKTNVNVLKLKEWKNLTNKLTEIKLAWKRMKLAAKANFSFHRREQSQTGGGTKPPSPSPEDLQIMAIAPHDFVIEVNDFDSDAVIPNITISKSVPIPGPSSQDEPIITIIEETPEPKVMENQVLPFINDIEEIKYVDHTQKEEAKGKCKPKIAEKKGRKVTQNRSEEGRQAIIYSNLDFKNRQIEMLEVEHTYKIKISELKIKKLELEIGLIENQLKTNSKIQKNNSGTEE